MTGARTILAATAAVVLLTVSAVAWGSTGEGQPKASASAKVKKQIKSLKSQLTALEGRTSATPTGPAGGDLAGSYPDPLVRTGAVTADDIAPGSVTSAALGTVRVRAGTPTIVTPAGGTASAFCNPGEQILAGEAGFYDDLAANVSTIGGRTGSLGYEAHGFNGTGTNRLLTATAICLAP